MSFFAKKLPSDLQLLGVESGNPDIDFYLSCPRRPLAVLRKPLHLTPFVQGKESGINRFKFLKVIGVGGFSRVYLGMAFPYIQPAARPTANSTP